ncbi:pilus assembly protein PilN [Coxiella endosymbiont of Ornithodoros amblus]|uniref:pilus assembly protein PilN n=1 Tax=Coxiella endosymbiont of Ornithodoros amblus TaxID=1656166 RepID=UPI00244E11B0|nr:pilus assembly protein PilN [Coxiella endosymbiont of Ornithodoros amblus]
MLTIAVIGWLNFLLHRSIRLEKKKIPFLTKQLVVFHLVDRAKAKEINKIPAQWDIISPIKFIKVYLKNYRLTRARGFYQAFLMTPKIKKLLNSILLSYLSQKFYVSFTIRLSYTR